MENKLQKEIIMRSIKIVDIGYIAVIYAFVAIVFSAIMDKYLGTYDKKKAEKQSLARVSIEAIIYIWFVGAVIYVVRNLVELIPFPLNGVHGFNHFRVKELGNATVFVFIAMYYQKNFKDRLDYLFARIKKSI